MENTKTTQQNNRITDILHKIQNKEISIHSKTFFRVKAIALTALVIAICIITIILCSFILFTIHITGQSHVIDFGFQGVKLFVYTFPWFLLALDLVLILILGYITRNTSFGYKIPGMYILFAALGIVVVSGYIVESYTSLHTRMLERSQTQQLPLVDSLYKNARRAPPKRFEIYRGVVVEKKEAYMLVDVEHDEVYGSTTQILVRFATTSDPILSDAEIGQTVFISGKMQNGQIMYPKVKIIPPHSAVPHIPMPHALPMPR
jgi:hypothetical protein